MCTTWWNDISTDSILLALIAYLFLNFYERDSMSHLYESNKLDIIVIVKDNFWYIDHQ